MSTRDATRSVPGTTGDEVGEVERHTFSARPGSLDSLFWGGLAAGLVLALLAAVGAPSIPWAPYAGLGLAFFTLAARHPEIGFYAVVAMIPLGAYRGRIHWLTAAALLLVFGLATLRGWRPWGRLRSSIWPWLGLFVVINGFACALSPYPRQAIEGLLRFGLGIGFILLTLLCVTRRGFTRYLPATWTASVTLGSLLAVFGYILGLELFATNVHRFRRATGATISPINLSLLIVCTLPLMAHYLFCGRSARVRHLAFAAILLNLAALITTFSRGGFLLLCVVTVAVLFEYRSRLRELEVAKVTVLVLSFILLSNEITNLRTAAPAVVVEEETQERSESRVLTDKAKGTDFWERQSTVSPEEDFSVGRRSSYIRVALDAFLERPLLGWGTMVFRDIYAESDLQKARPGRWGEPRRAHNTYLEVLVGSGLLGLLVFGALCASTLWSLTVARRAFAAVGDEGRADLATAYRLCFLMLLSYFLLQSGLYHKLLFLLLPLGSIALRVARTETEGHELPSLV